GLAWRDVALIRTISRFLRQVRVPYSQDYMWATLRKHSGLASKLVELFHVRFDPRPSSPPSQGARALRHSASKTRVNALMAGATAEDNRSAREGAIIAEME